MNACSYFQYEAFPGTMIFVYVVLYLCEIATFLMRLSVTLWMYYRVGMCLKRSSKQPGGLKALLLPWGCAKSPECSQYSNVRIAILLCWAIVFSGITLCWYISAMFEPGFGLVNSLDTGKFYFGAKWNEDPLPRYAHEAHKRPRVQPRLTGPRH